jgi:hypothetical protein
MEAEAWEGMDKAHVEAGLGSTIGLFELAVAAVAVVAAAAAFAVAAYLII